MAEKHPGKSADAPEAISVAEKTENGDKIAASLPEEDFTVFSSADDKRKTPEAGKSSPKSSESSEKNTPTPHESTNSVEPEEPTGIARALIFLKACVKECNRLLLNFVESKAFGSFILFIILINTAILVAQTVAQVAVRWGWHIAAVDNVFMSIYIIEAALKIIVHKKAYFADGWNLLDFNIVMFSMADFLFPFIIQNVSFNAASIFRVLRIFRAVRALRALRVLRTIRFLNTLQVILMTLLQSIKSIGAIVVLIVLFMCIFSVVGRDLYSKSAPEFFGNLFLAFFTLFQLLTLDDWFLIYQTVTARDPSQMHVFLYLVLYIIVEYFVLLNLFVAVLVDNFQLTMVSQSSQSKKKNQHHEEVIDDEDYYLYRAGSKTVTKVVEWESTQRKNIASYYPSFGRGEQRLLKDYFHVLTAYENTSKTLENYEHIIASMADICSDTAETEES